MSRVRAVGWLAALLSAALVAEPMRASVRDFVAEITLELPDESAVALGSAAGRATVSSSDELLFPPSALSGPTAATFTPPGSLCVSTISLVPSGFRGGVLGPSAENGFGGAIGIDGNVVLEVLAGAVPGLPPLGVPLVLGSLASPVNAAFTVSPASTAPPAQVVLSLSYSRWSTVQAQLTGTHDGVLTGQRETSGALLSTELGGQTITLVSPIHIHYASIDDGGFSKTRTIALAGRMVIALPGPGALASELTGVGALVAIGLFRRHRSRGSD